jgi:hypothetical protein
MNGFTDEQIIELRRGGASWDNKINVSQTVGIAANKGKVGTVALEEFYAAGYTKKT